MLTQITSLSDLKHKASKDVSYKHLAIFTAQSLTTTKKMMVGDVEKDYVTAIQFIESIIEKRGNNTCKTEVSFLNDDRCNSRFLSKVELPK